MRPRPAFAVALLLLAAGAAHGQSSVSIGDATVVEGGAGTVQQMLFEVLVTTAAAPSPGPRPPVDVTFQTRDGLAKVADGDYTMTSGVLTFSGSPGEEVQTVIVSVNGDLKVEADENLFVDLVMVTGATIDDGEGEGTILDDDDTSLSIGDATLAEGDAGVTQAVFTATLTAPSDFAVTAFFSTRDGTATTLDGDYQAGGGAVTFAPGATSQPVTVTVNGDLKVEPDETFFVDLANADGATIADGEGLGTLLNDDVAGLSVDDVTVTEGNDGTVTATFLVSLSAVSGSSVSVDYATRDGSATLADGDYRLARGTLTFGPGQTSLPLPVTVVGDRRVEPDESFFVDLTNAVGAAIADGSGRATILNDDATAISIDDVSVVEGDTGGVDAVFTVSLSTASAVQVGVDYATRDGTASASAGDYSPRRGRLTFSPGQTALTVPIRVNGDTAVETDETFFVDLTNPSGASLAVARGGGTIVNDDALSEVRLVSAPPVAEDAAVAVVTAERFGDLGVAARVTVVAASGTATAGEDFTALTRTLSWAAGVGGRRSVEIEILDDNLSEGDETVVVSLSDPVRATLAAPASLDLVILDDDAATDLQIVGETQVTGTVGEEIELRVVATTAAGAPVAGVAVTWAIQGAGELLDGDTTTTDAAGEAVQQLLLGATPGVIAVTASLAGGGVAGARSAAAPATVEFEITVRGDLDDLFPSADSGEATVAGVINDVCLENPEDLDGFCDYLFGLDPDDQRAVIEALIADDVAGQATVAIGGQRVQLANISSRLSAARAGSGGAVSQLALSVRGQGVPLGGLVSWSPAAGSAESRLLERIDAALFHPQETAPTPAPEAVVDAPSRWSLFVNGSLEIGDRPTTQREEGFDLETLGLTLGVDYRLRNDWVLGAAIGYLDTETDLAGGGSLDATGTSLSVFGSYFRGGFWLDAIVAYGSQEYESSRVIVLPQPFAGETRFVATADPDGRQVTIALGAGYDAAFGATSLGGFANVSRVEVDIDAYTETGAAPFDLTIEDQSLESLLVEAGIELTHAASRGWGVLQPLVRASVLHELEDDSRRIVGSFAADSGKGRFGLPTDPPDRDFLRLGVGVTATFARGRALYLLYETDLERDDLDLSRWSGGARFEF